MAVEYVNGTPVIRHDGVPRKLAALPPTQTLRSAFDEYRANYPVLPRTAWRDVDHRAFKVPTKDQGQHGSCTGHASVTALEYHRKIAGMPDIRLSATFPYAQLNGGQDNGASVSATMDVLMQMGTCRVELCGVDQIFLNQIPPQAKEDAKDHKALEAYKCRTFDDFASALILYGPCALGILIGQNFSRLDRNGIAPLPDVTVGGHALAAVGLKNINGKWYILVHNSWGPRWGFDGGFTYISEQHTYKMLDGFALIIPRESDKPDDGDEPPVVLKAPAPKSLSDQVIEEVMKVEDAKFLAAVNKAATEAKPPEAVLKGPSLSSLLSEGGVVKPEAKAEGKPKTDDQILDEMIAAEEAAKARPPEAKAEEPPASKLVAEQVKKFDDFAAAKPQVTGLPKVAQPGKDAKGGDTAKEKK